MPDAIIRITKRDHDAPHLPASSAGGLALESAPQTKARGSDSQDSQPSVGAPARKLESLLMSPAMMARIHNAQVAQGKSAQQGPC